MEHITNITVETTSISTLRAQNETLQNQLAHTTTNLMSMKVLVETLCKELREMKEN